MYKHSYSVLVFRSKGIELMDPGLDLDTNFIWALSIDPNPGSNLNLDQSMDPCPISGSSIQGAHFHPCPYLI